MEPLANRKTLINDHRVAYGVYGEGVPVILLHGTPFSSLIWRNIVPNLTQAGYKVHLFDLLGYGLSERPWSPEVDTSISGQVPVLEALIRHWNLDGDGSTFHIVGHDIGGAVVQRFGILSEMRKHIRSITLIDCVSYDSYPSPRTLQLMKSGLEKMEKATDSAHRAHFHEWLSSAAFNVEKFQSSSLPVYIEYISGSIGQGSFFQHQIRHYDPKHTLEVADRYGELGSWPLKLIWGKEDAWQNIRWAEKLHGAIPGSTLEVVDEAGHLILEDQPEKVSKILVEHLSDH